MKKIANTCITVAVILVIMGTVFFFNGFDKKNNYYNNEDYSSSNKNVYVGGDAYNYIINSNYFTGFIILGCSSYICSTMLICMGLFLQTKGKEFINTNTNGVHIFQEASKEELPPL